MNGFSRVLHSRPPMTRPPIQIKGTLNPSAWGHQPEVLGGHGLHRTTSFDPGDRRCIADQHTRSAESEESFRLFTSVGNYLARGIIDKCHRDRGRLTFSISSAALNVSR